MKRSQPIDYVKDRQKELSMNKDVKLYEQNGKKISRKEDSKKKNTTDEKMYKKNQKERDRQKS